MMKTKIVSAHAPTDFFSRTIIKKALEIVKPTIVYNLHEGNDIYLVHSAERVLVFIKPNLGDAPGPEMPLGNSNFTVHNLSVVIDKFSNVGWDLEVLKIIPSQFITSDMIRMHYPEMFAGERYDNMRTIFSEDELRTVDMLYLPDHKNIKIVHAMRLLNDYGYKSEDIYRVWGAAIEKGYCTGDPSGLNVIQSDQKNSFLGRSLVALIRDQEMCNLVNNGLPFLLANGFSVFYAEIAKTPEIKMPFMVFKRNEYGGIPIEQIKPVVVGSSNPRMAKEGSIRRGAWQSSIGDLRGFRSANPGPTNNGVHCSVPKSGTKEVSMFFPDLWLANHDNSSIQYTVVRKQFKRYQNEGSKDFGIKFAKAEGVTDSSGMISMAELCKQDGGFPKTAVIFAGAGSGGRFLGDRNGSMQQTSKSLAKVGDRTILGHRLHYLDNLLQSGVPITEIFLLTPSHHHEIERHLADLRAEGKTTLLDRVIARKSTVIPRLRPFSEDLLNEDKFKKKYPEVNERQARAKYLGTNGGQLALKEDGSICFNPPGPICAVTDFILFRLKDMIQNGTEVVAINSMEDIGFMLYPGVLNHVKNGDAPIYYSLIESDTSNFSGGGLAKIDGKQCIVPRKDFANLEFKYKNTFHVYINIENLLKWLGTTKEEFLLMEAAKIRRLINLNIFSKINPTFEVKPYEGWVGQVTWHIDDLAKIMQFGLIFQDDGYKRDFCELKTPEEIDRVHEFLDSHVQEFGP